MSVIVIRNFVYYDRRIANTDVDPKYRYQIKEYPSTLTKKVSLLLQFKRTLLIHDTMATTVKSSENPLHVKKWKKTLHAYMFKMNNNVLQVTFSDSSQIIFLTSAKKLYYLNKKNEGSLLDLKNALESTLPELSKRIKYAKEILEQSIKKTKSKV